MHFNITTMPEGPEVKNLVDQLQILLSGKVLRNIEVISGPHKKFSQQVAKLKPLFEDKNIFIKFRNIKCKGKFIYFELILYRRENENSEFTTKGIKFIGNHLGMTGHWRKDEGNHTMVKLTYSDQPHDSNLKFLYFDDMRHIGKIYLLKRNELIQKLNQLGPDALSDQLTEDLFMEIMHNKNVQNKMIGNVLVDQKIISGIGNYLRADILYSAKINPRKKVKDIGDAKLKTLYSSVKSIPLQAYNVKGTTIKTYRADIEYQEPGGYDPIIYGKKIDPLGNSVETMKLGNRTMHWVPAVQK